MRFIPTKRLLKILIGLTPLALLPFWTSWGVVIWGFSVGSVFLLSFYFALFVRSVLLASSWRGSFPNQLFTGREDEFSVELFFPEGEWSGQVFPVVKGPLDVLPACQEFYEEDSGVRLKFCLWPLRRGEILGRILSAPF